MERTWATPIQRGDDVTDPELKAYLDGMRQDLTQQIAESRQHAEQLNQSTRQDLMQQMDGMRQDLTQQIAESRQHAEQLNREARILVEDLHHQVQLVAEGVMTVSEKLDRFHDEVKANFGLDKRVMRLEAQRRSGSDA